MQTAARKFVASRSYRVAMRRHANGGFLMTQTGADFERQMTIASEAMDKHKVALSVLAQGENSPYWSEELVAEVETAKVRLEKYRNPIQGR